jgi:hypothetical protein
LLRPCGIFQVPAGEYQLSALPVDTERSSGLMFSPGSIGVNANGPLLDLEFSQVCKGVLLPMLFAQYIRCFLD